MIERYNANLDTYFKGKILVMYGPRQVGKTTLLKTWEKRLPRTVKSRMVSGDNILVHEAFRGFGSILAFVEGIDVLIIDEAQQIPNIGIGLKILYDNKPDLRIIVTGSSSFELAGQVGEPLTGRKNTLIMYPLSLLELSKQFSPYELQEQMEDFLIYGMYPAVFCAANKNEKREILQELLGSYLLKDVFTFDRIKSSKTLLDLLRLLAFQTGFEVSVHELAQKLAIDGKTVSRYLDILEKAFVLFSVRGYSKNLRNEIVRKCKYYFFDTGLRNALIANFNPLFMRNDVGQLWENFMFVERMKKRAYKSIYANQFFWRTWQQKEIDLIEERDGKLFAYEFKYRDAKTVCPKDFTENYPESEFSVIHSENWKDFIL